MNELHLFAIACVVPCIVGAFSPRIALACLAGAFALLAIGAYA